jgi:hypothetical protein
MRDTPIARAVRNFGERHFRFSELLNLVPEASYDEVRSYIESRIANGTMVRLRARDWRGVLYCVQPRPLGHEKFFVSVELIDAMASLGNGKHRPFKQTDAHDDRLFSAVARAGK